MKKRLIFGAGIALLALQTATTFADDPMGGGGPPPPESSSSMSSIVPPVSSSSTSSVSSASSSSVMGTCTCVSKERRIYSGTTEMQATSVANANKAYNETIVSVLNLLAPSNDYLFTFNQTINFTPVSEATCDNTSPAWSNITYDNNDERILVPIVATSNAEAMAYAAEYTKNDEYVVSCSQHTDTPGQLSPGNHIYECTIKKGATYSCSFTAL